MIHALNFAAEIVKAAPGHGIAGYSFAELVALIGLISAVSGIAGWLLKHLVIEPVMAPLKKSMTELTESIRDLHTVIAQTNDTVADLLNRVNRHGERLDKLEQQAARHDERLSIKDEDYNNHKEAH